MAQPIFPAGLKLRADIRSSDVAVQVDIARVSRVLAPRRQLLLPVCVAWMVHVPTETSVTVDPDTAQMAVVCEVK